MFHGGPVREVGANVLDRPGDRRLPAGAAAPLPVPDKEPGPLPGTGPPGPPPPWGKFLVRVHGGQQGRGGHVPHALGEHQHVLEHGAAAGAGGHGGGGGPAPVGDPGGGNRQPPGQGDPTPGVGGPDRGLLRGE